MVNLNDLYMSGLWMVNLNAVGVGPVEFPFQTIFSLSLSIDQSDDNDVVFPA